MRHRPQRELDPSEYRWMICGVFGCLVLSYVTEPDLARPWHVVVVAAAAVAFVVRGRTVRVRTELFAAWTVLPVALVVSRPGAPMEGAFFIPVLMVFSVAAADPSRGRSLTVAVVSAAVPFGVNLQLEGLDDIGWVAWTMAHLFTYVLGRVVHELSTTIRELDEARSALADQAVLEERRRIARELHDIAGHTLAAVMLHVTGARHVLARDPADADRALADAEDVGRRSLDQIRSTVAALRTSETGTDASIAGLADVDALTDEYRRAGLVVRSSIGVEPATVDPAVGVAAHRIVRESLANVARHTSGNEATVSITPLGSAGVTVEVVDRGAAAGPVEPSVPHFGLIGMTERAKALGGLLEAGPTADGWRVVARLPAPAPTLDDDPTRRAVGSTTHG